ncbi:TolC family outer membrane protein [Zavarzinia sp. CC-PAN008]|uniref:TolC family outer membrane protein n=1 Tax=Zavarzinia sp. CC-PAN008 TaxID=3243332 RepID=UPI003F749A7E
MRQWGGSLGVAFLVAAGLAVGPAQAETLMDTLVQTYQSNPTLESQRAQQRATDENVPQARSGWRPTVVVSGQAGVGRQGIDTDFGYGGDTLFPAAGQVQVAQPIYRGGRVDAGIDQAENSVAAGRAVLSATEQQVLLQAVTAYMDVLRDQAVLELNQNQVTVLNRQLDAAKDRFEVGEITRTDVAQSEARVSGSISQRRAAEARLTSSRAAYLRIVGSMPGNLDQPPPPPPLPTSEDEAREAALNSNPNLRAARYSEAAARDAVRIAKGALLPTADIVASAGIAHETSQANTTIDSQQVVAQVNIPLYQSGAEYSDIRRAQQTASQRLVEIAQAQRQVEEGVTNAWEALIAARAIVTSSQDQVRANEIAAEGVRQEAEVGSRTTLDVLDAEQELLNARVTLVGARRDEYVAAFQLLAATGLLTVEYLRLPVAAYDPALNYEQVRDAWWGYPGFREGDAE